MDFKTSLFDFDFEHENFIRRADALIWASDIGEPHVYPAPAPPVSELPEVVEDTIRRLEKMAERALDEERMEVYFRILDELERYREALPAEDV